MDVAANGGEGGSIDIVSLRSRRFATYTHDYTQRDLVLYALGLGCSAATPSDMRYVYEGSTAFAPLPTYGIVAAHPALERVPLGAYLPGGLDRAAALHGEQYLELRAPLPAAGRLVSRPELVDIQGKGNGCVVVLRTVTTDEASGREVAVNEFTTFILGKGGVKTPWPPAPRPPAAVAPNDPPACGRPPDAVLSYATTPDQAALYRLSGDYNPLHIDSTVSGRLGFPHPILHGLCTAGISVRLLLREFGGDDPARLKSVKVRFSKHVFPGETLKVEAWKVDGSTSSPPGSTKVVFRTWVVQRGVLAVTNAAIELLPPVQSAAKL